MIYKIIKSGLRKVIDMEIHSIGFNHPHDKNFTINRPNGAYSWLFLLIKTPAIFLIQGTDIVTKPNSFVLFSPEEPHWYRTFEEEYIDDWFHFSLDHNDQEMVKSLGIPINTIVELGNITELTTLIRHMTYEFNTNTMFRSEISKLYLQILFYKLSRQLLSINSASTNATSVYYERIAKLRNEIYNTPQIKRSVDEMAEQLFMSRSGFQHTYKKIFGVSVIADIVTSRLQRSKFLLSTTDMTISEIASHCGYNSEIYLMRQFKEKFGVTPTEFRRCI